MTDKTVSATEFQNHAGYYLDLSARAPTIITRHGRPSRVLLDYESYQKLIAQDTRRAYYPEELPDDIKAEFAKGYQGEDETKAPGL